MYWSNCGFPDGYWNYESLITFHISLEKGDHLNKCAIQDATMALELDPGNALCYANRGDAYYNLGNYEKAISDYKTGARMGQEGCQRVLRSMGISW